MPKPRDAFYFLLHLAMLLYLGFEITQTSIQFNKTLLIFFAFNVAISLYETYSPRP